MSIIISPTALSENTKIIINNNNQRFCDLFCCSSLQWNMSKWIYNKFVKIRKLGFCVIFMMCSSISFILMCHVALAKDGNHAAATTDQHLSCCFLNTQCSTLPPCTISLAFFCSDRRCCYYNSSWFEIYSIEWKHNTSSWNPHVQCSKTQHAMSSLRVITNFGRNYCKHASYRS